MSKPYYVILTGSKNNAGDFLIKHRAKQLFSLIRQDRDVLDLNAWEVIDEKKLQIINNSECLILTGGPSLQFDMYPKIYKLREDLNEIKVPIVCMGVGYKDHNGEWFNTSNYKLSADSHKLLKKIATSGYKSSVRDYNSLSAMQHNGYDNFIMTGCPALYEPSFFDKETEKSIINNVIFSLGVSYLESPSFFESMKNVVLKCKQIFKDKNYKVLLHHSYNEKNETQKAMVNFFEKNNIAFKDISGSADELISEYSNCDLHVGYRVHAHIFMSSISKRSILINEDGRGKALLDVIGGVRLDCYKIDDINLENRFKSKIKRDYHFKSAIAVLETELDHVLEYEISNKFPRIRKIRNNINDNFELMKLFLLQLP